MESRSDFQLHALCPDRIVVIDAIDAVVVEPIKATLDFRVLALERRNRTAGRGRQHNRFHSQHLYYVFQLGDRLLGRVHRNHRYGCQSIAEFAEDLGVIHVKGAAYRLAQLPIPQFGGEHAEARVDDREIKAELIHPAMQQTRKRAGGTVKRVAHRMTPGSNSTVCPSASTTGWFNWSRNTADLEL